MGTIVEVKEDSNGDAFIEIPPEMMEALGWNEKTILCMRLNHGCIELTKKTHWTPEELQEGDTLENVVDDVSANNTVHYIIDGDRQFMIRPIDEVTKAMWEEENNER